MPSQCQIPNISTNMKVQSLLATAVLTASGVAGHTIFQKVSVNGADQGQLKGVRAPDSDNPIYSVNDANIACNANLQHKDSTVISVPAGAKVGSWWGHVIGGPQGANDKDNPIASSHKGRSRSFVLRYMSCGTNVPPGPIQYYLAKVDNAATTGTSGSSVVQGQSWHRCIPVMIELISSQVASDGLANGKWAVDTMIANGGWHYFTLPTCIAPGDYLLRAELLALHSAYSAGGAQCQLNCSRTLESWPLIHLYSLHGVRTNQGHWVRNQQGSQLRQLPWRIPCQRSRNRHQHLRHCGPAGQRW